MPKTYRISLTKSQQSELEKATKKHEKSYVRERASAILKVADNHSLRQVAYKMLLTRHAPETIKTWCERYLSDGLPGLLVKEGRGRKPSFFPSDKN